MFWHITTTDVKLFKRGQHFIGVICLRDNGVVRLFLVDVKVWKTLSGFETTKWSLIYDFAYL